MDIASWLQDLGLERYAGTFREHEVDLEVLGDLTEADLEKLGIPLGPRKKLLRAIARLAPPEAAAQPEPPRAEAERRQLTVMFVDLVGSTELSTRLDPEDMGALIRAFQDCCADVVKRWGGHLAKFMGDGALAYFGWPRAHEDDAERAVRAGLELAAALGRVPAPEDARLAARVGIATGPVLVGDIVGTGAAQEQAVVGETPNLAARLQALAAPGTVVIAARTRHLLGGLFALTDLGPVRLKGFSEALSAFRVDGEGRSEGRFEALRGGRLTPLVGREHELAILLERWAWAKDGDGQVVLLAGEPGIGKSRLIRALRDALGSEPHVALSHFCSPYHANSALHPIISQLERAVGLTSDDQPEARLAKLEALVGQATGRLDEALPLLAALLGIATNDRYPALNLSPQRQKQRTLEVLLEQLAGLARQRPVLELYEDLHWVDPSTLELLDLLVERARGLACLVVLTYRPEFTPRWLGQAHVTALTMNRLGRRQGAAMVERITGGRRLPDAVLEQIVARTDGVPLFVEELTKAVLESGLLADAGDHYELTGPLPPLAIPTTLHDSLMARLDRLAPVKEVAQTAAVIGREFSHGLLAAIVERPAAELDDALDRLVEAELIFRRGTPPEASYTFKHALVQDAAYQSLVRSRRQIIHARIASALEEQSSEIVTVPAEVLAHHWTAAGQGEPAVRNWLRAGKRAAERSADAEAVAHLTKGLEALSLLPEAAERDKAELELQVELGTRLMALRGWTAPEVVRAWSRARELCDRLADPQHLATVLWGQCVVQYLSADFAPALETAALALQWADSRDHLKERILGHRTLGHILTHLARFEEAQWHLEQTALLGAEAPAGIFAGHAYEPVVTSRTYRARCLLHSGYPDQCTDQLDQAVAEAERLTHLPTIAFVVFQLIELGYERHQPEITRIGLKRLIPLAREQGYAQYLAMAVALAGWIKAMEGKYEAGCAEICEGTKTWEGIGNILMRPFLLSMLAHANVRASHRDEALCAANNALASIAANGEVLWEPELHRLRGDAFLLRGDYSETEACYSRAIEVARNQSAKLVELRASTSLGRLWIGQDRGAAAYDLLAPLYDWFTEGFETPDLKAAKALLDGLK